jgi:ABC-type glycerol-3-phosphate transport system substrate-binding protein
MSDPGQILSPDQLWIFNSSLRQKLGEGPAIMAYPTYDGSGAVYASASEYAAINANCRDKAAALDFIKILLSKDIQKSMDSHGNNNITFGLPVNIKAYEEDRDYYMSDSSVKYASVSDSQGYITPLKVPTELAAQMDSMIAKAQVTEIIDTEVYSIVYDELDRFLNGKKSAEETAKTIDRKVSLYLNE